MYSSAIQLLSVLLFAICLYHSWRTDGRRYAQQWFGVGYLFALLYQVLLVQFRVISYSDQMLEFGSAPTLTSLILPALFYVAYVISSWISPNEEERPTLLLMFFLTPALALSMDATALAFDWWSFPSQSRAFLDGVPYFMPLTWGAVGAMFYGAVRFVRRIRFRGSGQLFALILATPLMAGVGFLMVIASQLVVDVLSLVPNDFALNIVIGVLLLAMPVAYAVRSRFSMSVLRR